MRWGVAGFQAVSGLRKVAATRYVTPLREGGSLPGLVEADDDGLYVLKFRGAGQGVKALVAEIVCRRAGARAGAGGAGDRADGGRSRARRGGAGSRDPGADHRLGGARTWGSTSCRDRCPTRPRRASSRRPSWRPRWCGSTRSISNVDRTPRNPNLLVWHERLWLIDHGAALYFHHRDWDTETDAPKPVHGDLRPRAAADRRADLEADERPARCRRRHPGGGGCGARGVGGR